MSLRIRVTLAMAMLAFFVVGGAGLAARAVVSRQLQHETDQALLRRVSPSGPGPGGGGRGGRRGPHVEPDGSISADASGPAILPRACLGARSGDSVILVQVIDANGLATQCAADFVTPIDDADRALAKRVGRPRFRTVTIKNNGEEERFRLLTASSPFGAVQIARELRTEEGVIGGLDNRFAALGLVATASAALMGWFLARRLVRPIEQLRVKTDEIAATQTLETIVPPKGNDEVASLSRSFNSMISALITSREQQHRLIADASHELRTPLTSLRTNIEVANRSRPLPPDQLRIVLDAALLEVGELTDLTEELVELATDRTLDEPMQEVDLVGMANDVAERTNRRTGRMITVDCGSSTDHAAAETRGHPRMLERAIANLVENAVKYAPAPTPISIRVREDEIAVIDHGPGIKEADLPLIFDRFYRSDLARTAPGSGLGLAIVRKVAERHHGSVFAMNNVGGGATVGFRFSPNQQS
jgi:two-component system, OmpR family, sensor histidine kinase MprB